MLLDDIIIRLRRSGYKVTPQRVTIIKVIIGSNEHLTPAELWEKARQVDPEIGEVTVYRTLNILSKLGLVCEIHLGENTPSYIGSPIGHHDHLICLECGKVINFTNCGVSKVSTQLKSETGFTIQQHRLDFYGKCRECGKREISEN